MAQNTDFIGFTFNGRHSSEFNICLVSDGSRYQDVLVPSPIDYTEQIPGGVGQYYFGSDEDIREFSLEIAFDNITETILRDLRNWLSPGVIGDLIFDERPYKTYTAKISQSPSISFICFDKKDSKGETKRIYKGEGSINFICYYPLAVTSGEKKELKSYSNTTNLNEWAESSGLLEDLHTEDKNGYDHYIETGDQSGKINLFNPGDQETDFILSFPKPSGEMKNTEFTLTDGRRFVLSLRADDSDPTIEKYGAISDDEKRVAQASGGTIVIDTKKNRIIYQYTAAGKDVEESIYFALKEGSFFKIPKNQTSIGGNVLSIKTDEEALLLSSIEIEYDYLYY